jgi:hypothetical protein
MHWLSAERRDLTGPESLEVQVRVAGLLASRARPPRELLRVHRPQYQRDPAYFEPLRSLELPPHTEPGFALVPYHPWDQAESTTEDRVRVVDENLGDRPWGIGTECGMAQAEREEVPTVLDLDRDILATR